MQQKIPEYFSGVKDFLIVGLGISGISVCWELEKLNLSYTVVDACFKNSSTYISGGLINPVTGRRYTLQWNIYELLSCAKKFYSELGELVNQKLYAEKTVVRFHKSEEGANEWNKRKQIISETGFIDAPEDITQYNNIFHTEYGGIIIKHALQINSILLTEKFTEYISSENKLIKEKLNFNELIIRHASLEYHNEKYKRIIFCEGIEALQNPYFNTIPFIPSKGECLLLEIPELHISHIFSKEIILIPQKNNVFWAGATNSWNYLDMQPTQAGKNALTEQLNKLLKIPYKIIEHKAAIRPTIKDRAPVTGEHPYKKNLFILNGMGTKGMMLAPYYAKKLLSHIFNNTEIPYQANVNRFIKYF